MPNFVAALKDEIRRLAKREVKASIGKPQKAVIQHRKDIAQLKRQLVHQGREIARLKKLVQQRAGQPQAVEEKVLDGIRFSARSVRAQRRRLGLSAADYGKIIGVSGLTIYNWEAGKTRPRESQFAAIVSVRGIGKREATKRLEAKTK